MFNRVKFLLASSLVLMVGFGNPISGQEASDSPPEVTEPSTPAPSTEKLKVAIVDVQLVFRQYHKTKVAQQQISKKRAIIAGSEKNQEDDFSRLSFLKKELTKTDGKEQDVQAEKENLRIEFNALQEQLQLKARQRSAILQQKNQLLNRQMTVRMGSLLSEIKAAIARYAEANNFDLVIDSSGLTTSQAPLLLFAEDSLNITTTILKELNKDAPPK